MVIYRLAIVYLLTAATLAVKLEPTMDIEPKNSPQISIGMLESSTRRYDGYVLAMEWAGGLCKTSKCTKNRPIQLNYFNIHGLWPTILNNSFLSPSFCHANHIDYSHLSSKLRIRIWGHWNALYKPEDWFLDHEWLRHGTCWTPQLLSPVETSKLPDYLQDTILEASNAYKSGNYDPNYFLQVALSLASNYNPAALLAANNIHPDSSKQITTDRLVSALAKVNITNFGAVCQVDNRGKSMLTEIHLCFSPSYNPIDCDRQDIKCPRMFVYAADSGDAMVSPT